MANGIELDMSNVITEWRVKTERNLCNEFVSYSIDHCHVLVFQIDVCVIGANRCSRVADKDLTNILGDQTASSQGNVNQPNNLVKRGIEDNDVPSVAASK